MKMDWETRYRVLGLQDAAISDLFRFLIIGWSGKAEF